MSERLQDLAGNEVDQARRELLAYQSVLLRLGAESEGDFEPFLKRLLKSDAVILGVDRVSYWEFEEGGTALRCAVLYTCSDDSFSDGMRLEESTHPNYFRAIRDELVIGASDALEDTRTHEFADAYLRPLGISSMMDAPVWREGRLWGVLCHEHRGDPREWRPEEQSFVLSLAQFVSMGLERRERKLAERALRESEERFGLFSNHARDFALVTTDPEGNISTQVQRLHGYGPEELAGRNLAVFYPPADVKAGRPARAMKEALRQGRYEEEGWLVRSDGSWFWARVDTTPLWTDTGELRGFASVAQDLTRDRLARENERLLERTRFTAERQALLAHLSSVVSSHLDTERSLPQAAALLTESLADGAAIVVKSGARGAVPSSAIAGLEVSRRALLGDAARGLADAVQAPLFLSQCFDAELEDLPADARTREVLRQLEPASLMVIPIRSRHRSFGVLAMVRTRPAHPFVEEDFLYAQEIARRLGYALDNARLYNVARESIRMREDFLTVAAHEFRTPLTTLRLQFDRIERACHGDDRVDLRRYAAVGRRQLSSMSSLIDEILDTSRHTGEEMPLHLQTVDLSQLIREVGETFALEAARSDSTLELDVAPDVRGRFDASRLEQMLTNLVSNAIRYGAGKPIRVAMTESPDEVCITVRDQGMGIAREDQRRIFGRYERATSSRHFGGLGLGLFIVRRVVDAHHGTIEVSSEPGRGSTFVVRLPRWPEVRQLEQESASVH